MKKNNNFVDKPTQSEMSELEVLFNSSDFKNLEKKAKELIAKYKKIPVLHNILGVALQKNNKSDEAILNFKEAISLQSNFEQAHNNLGNILQDLERYDEAIQYYKKAIKANPNYADAYSNLGNSLSQLGKFNEAVINQTQAIKLNPSNANFYTNLGSSLTDLGKYDEAIVNHKKSIKLNPNFAEAYSNLGMALAEVGEFDQAIRNHQKAVSLNPSYTQAILNESVIRLKLGDFKTGWKKYEARLGLSVKMRYQTEKIWDGKYLDGTLLVWCEQGIGDHIIFCSMLNDLRKLAKNILLEVDERLKKLLDRYFKQIDFLNIKIINFQDGIKNNFDKHIAIGSLGQYLRNSKEAFKTSPKKYLIPSSEEKKVLDGKINKKKFIVGISWKTLNKLQQHRNISLKEMHPILSNHDCNFVNLQFGDCDDDLNYIKTKYDINIQSLKNIDNYKDIDNLAALINCLDLVITIQNSTAHLACALGKNTWIMAAKNARWHWLKDTNNSVWYPSAKIFRQEYNGDWNKVISNISIDLNLLLNSR